jgi:hypothetical protein
MTCAWVIVGGPHPSLFGLVVPVSYSDSRVSSNGFRLRKPNSLGFP